MTQEEKELLLKDLCARLPYHVRLKVWLKDGTTEEGFLDLQHNYGDVLRDAFYYNKIKDIKPYLRPMSSMTEEERLELSMLSDNKSVKFYLQGKDVKLCFMSGDCFQFYKVFDWLNAHHFDYRGLLERGLALEAPADMYNIKEK